MMDQLSRILEPLRRRIFNLVARGVIKGVTEDGLQRLQVTVLTDEVLDRVERVQEYGFTSSPPVGAECVMLFLGGNRDHGVIIATDDRRVRFQQLASGEVAIYDNNGNVIHLKQGGEIDIKATGSVQVTAPQVTVNGNLTVTGSLTVDGDITGQGNITASGNVNAQNVQATAAVTGATVTGSSGVSSGSVSLASIKTAFDGHTHTDPQGGTTGGPNTSI